MNFFIDLRKDLQAFAKDGGIAKKIGIAICNPCFHACFMYRLSNLMYRMYLRPLAKLVWYLNRMIFNVDIDYHAKLAGGLVIKHGLGIVIGKDVVSKGKLTIYQGVTLGGNGKERLLNGEIIDMPVIDDDVIIYTNAMVFGPVIIGSGNHIKAGTIVKDDLPRIKQNQ